MPKDTSGNPLVSIVAVSYNHERWIVETLESIRRQTLSDFELIYVDDASQDRSAQIAMKWLDGQTLCCRRIIHSKNQGLPRTLNETVRLCRGKYIQLIACDDVLRPDKLRRQVEVLECAPPDTMLCCGGFATIDENGKCIKNCYYPDSYVFPSDPFIGLLVEQMKRIVFSSPTVLLRQAVVSAVGPYNETYVAEDFDMWLRIAFRFPVVFIPDVLVDYRVVRGSMSHDRSRHRQFALDRLDALEKYECDGARLAAIRGRRQAEQLRLVKMAVEDGEWPEAERWAKEYLESLNEMEMARCRSLLRILSPRNRRLAATLMQQYPISSGNWLSDVCLRRGLIAGPAVLFAVARGRQLIEKITGHVEPT